MIKLQKPQYHCSLLVKHSCNNYPTIFLIFLKARANEGGLLHITFDLLSLVHVIESSVMNVQLKKIKNISIEIKRM